MPRIDVSEDVLAAIRALRRDGKEPEDQVLQRVLGLLGYTPQEEGPGFIDATYAIHFPEGFEIFRTYKGRPYAARVTGGRWVLDDGMAGGMAGSGAYDSLNQLSQAVIDGNENAWMFWFFVGPDGTKRRIAELRDPAQVQKRPRRNRHRQKGARGGVLPVAREGVIPTPVVPSSMAPIAPAPAPSPVSRPPPASAPATAPEPAVGGMAWQPAPPKPKQG